RRSFSMANPPHDAELVELHVRRVAGRKFTRNVIEKMTARHNLRFEGPPGGCFLREAAPNPTPPSSSRPASPPTHPRREDVFQRGMARPMSLYWGGRRPKDLYMNALAEKWAAEHSSFKYVPVISDALPEDQWRGRTGFVHRAVMQDFPDLSGHQVYACGV